MEVNIYAPKSNHHERNDFNCYKNMDELKCEFLDFAYAYYERYGFRNGRSDEFI